MRLTAFALIPSMVMCAAPKSAPSCGEFGSAGTWRLRATGPRESLDATIQFVGSSAHLLGTMTMAEGWGEPLDYPLDSLAVRGDSIRFRFAPASILVEGRCSSPVRIRVRFGENLAPPWGTVAGTGSIDRLP